MRWLTHDLLRRLLRTYGGLTHPVLIASTTILDQRASTPYRTDGLRSILQALTSLLILDAIVRL